MIVCGSRFYRGKHRGERCNHPATGYQPLWRLYLCGIHRRGYLNVLPLAQREGQK